jgi:hypothetical protein
VREIKEWQAIMDHLRNMPVTKAVELSTIPVDERAAEVRASGLIEWEASQTSCIRKSTAIMFWSCGTQPTTLAPSNSSYPSGPGQKK